MKDKEKDKRLIIPKDAFEEEASEGLGRLTREEAEADLRELKGRLDRRLRKPRMIWLPAAAAVVILLVASALYISIFRDRSTGLNDLARAEEAMADSSLITMTEDAKSDTVMIAMAVPIETKGGLSTVTSSRREAADAPAAVTIVEADLETDQILAVAEDAKKEVVAEEVSEVIVVEAHEEPMAEEVIVEAFPMMQKAGVRSDNAARAKAASSPGAVMPDREASPVSGWEEYREWMVRHIIYPEGVDRVERQVIVVTFRVRADSTVYDLKAERTAGDLFTREAFRLIREGPNWAPAVRGGQVTEEEVRVSIVFK